MADNPNVGFQGVGFVGTGNMGWPMAACLVRAGFRVQANDELVLAAQPMFGPDADHTETALLCERLAGDELRGR